MAFTNNSIQAASAKQTSRSFVDPFDYARKHHLIIEGDILRGFDSFAEAAEAASAIGGEEFGFFRRPGGRNWEHIGHAYKGFSAADAESLFGDNYSVYEDGELYEADARESLAARLADGDVDLEVASEFIKSVLDEIAHADVEGRFIVAENQGGLPWPNDSQIARPCEIRHDGYVIIIGIKLGRK